MLFTGFQLEVDKFLIFTLTVFLTSLAAASTAFFVSAGLKVTGLANLMVALLFVIQMVSFVWSLSLRLTHCHLGSMEAVCMCTYSNELLFSCF